MEDRQKTELFESMAIPRAVMKLAIPTVLSSLVMVLYNLADTYFVGMLNNAVQNAAVTLAAPLLLAFNAVNNLFGVGSSSMMSRALGKKDHDTVARSSAFGFLLLGDCGPAVLPAVHHFSGAPAHRAGRQRGDHGRHHGLRQVDGDLRGGALHPQRGHGLPGPGRGLVHARQCGHHVRVLPQYPFGPGVHPALGPAHGRRGRWPGHLPLQLRGLRLLLRAAVRQAGPHLRVHRPQEIRLPAPHRLGVCARWASPPPSRTS